MCYRKNIVYAGILCLLLFLPVVSFAYTDTDGDNIDDNWEITHFGNLTHNMCLDSDADNITDLTESVYSTDPNNADTDNDTLQDGWEITNGYNPLVADIIEDSDSDGVADTWEIENLGDINHDLCLDSDADTLSDMEESISHTDPNSADTDSDGMVDSWEVSRGLDPLTDDSLVDSDGDGLSNLAEYVAGTNPSDSSDYANSTFEGFESGNLSAFYWFSGDGSIWNVTNNNTFQGSYSARTAPIADNDSNTLETTINCDAGKIVFYFSVSSEPDKDKLKFFIDGQLMGEWSGQVSYTMASYDVSAGLHDFQWIYVKDGSGSANADAAWIDNIIFPGKADTDSDGVIDAWEYRYFGELNHNMCLDSDGDGHGDLEDGLALTEPFAFDYDGDGTPDLWEIQYGFDPETPDANSDLDNDGLTNLQEYARGTLPYTPNDVEFGIHSAGNQGGEMVGAAINILSGNMVDARTDIGFSSPNRFGLAFQAVYNSQSNQSNNLGSGWSHTYSASLNTSYTIGSQNHLKITDETGRGVYFKETAANVYAGAFHELSRVQYENSQYVWYQTNGSKYGFTAAGKLSWMDDPAGNRLSLSYDGQNRLSSVTDSATNRVITFQYNANNQIQTITGPITDSVLDGIWVTFGYDASQNLTSVTYADSSGITYAYTDPNDVHNITVKRNKMNHLLATWGYDATDRADTNTITDGTGVAIAYTSASQVNVTDAYGTSRAYTITEISKRNRVTQMTGPGNVPYSDNARAWTYNNNMLLTQVEYTNGRIDQFQNHDASGSPQEIILGFGADYERTISFTWHPDMSAVLTRTEPSVLNTSGDKITVWDYDDPNDANDNPAICNENPTLLPYRVIEKGYTRGNTGAVVPYEYITEISYNGTGQILTVNGPLAGDEDITSYTYDPATGNLLTLTRPIVGNTVFSDYDAAGFVGRVTDVNNLNTDLTYDGRGRVTSILHPDGSTETRDYNIAGLMETQTNEDGVPHTYEYKADTGFLEKIIDGAGSYIVFIYDANGNQTEKAYHDVDNTLTKVTNWTYQHPTYPGMLYREIQPDNTYTQYNYDDAGNVTTITDPKGNTTSYTADVFNRPSVTIQPGTLATSYEYDLHGNLVSVLNAEGHDTAYTFDDMGRAVQTTSPDSGTTAFTYDEAGDLRWKTNAKGIAVEYEYDELSRLTDIHYPNSGNQTAYSIAYTYDTFQAGDNYGIGRQTGITDPTGSTTFKYNNRGRAFEKTSTIDNLPFTLSRTFTPAGRVLHIANPTGRTMNFTLSDCNCSTRKVETTYNAITTILSDNLEYRPFGQSKGMTRPNADNTDSTVANQYDLAGRTTVANPGAPKERSFTYDVNGNLETVTSVGTPWYNRTFTYNALNQLTGATGPFGNGTINYTYDNVYNRQTETISGITDTYNYASGTSRMSSVVSNWNDGITGAPKQNTVAYTHDVNGNTTAKGSRVFTYNQNNQLVKAEEGSTILGEYQYNGLSQRVRKTAGGVTTYFIYDFLDNLIAESNAAGTIQTEYLYRGSARLAKVDISAGSAAIYYYMNDRLGTPEALIDENETVVWEAVYKPFGEADVHPASSIVNNLRLPGQYFDAETGLHYNYYRYYDPGIGRYLTTDPIGLAGGINLYAYVGGNPINLIDPFGLENWGKVFSGLAMVGGGVGISTLGVLLAKTPSQQAVHSIEHSQKIPAIEVAFETYGIGHSSTGLGMIGGGIWLQVKGWERVAEGITENTLSQEQLRQIEEYSKRLEADRRREERELEKSYENVMANIEYFQEKLNRDSDCR